MLLNEGIRIPTAMTATSNGSDDILRVRRSEHAKATASIGYATVDSLEHPASPEN